jgi:integrase/recombinase XerD
MRVYILAVEQFAYYFHKSPELMGAEEIGQFQLHRLQEKKLALGTIALRMGAFRFLYKKTLKRRDLDFDDLPLLKTPKKLPVVLSPEEVIRLIEAAPNLLDRTFLLLLYAIGLRRTEAAHLKVSDIDSSLMLIHVHQGKGPRPLTATDSERARRIAPVLADGEDQTPGVSVPDS